MKKTAITFSAALMLGGLVGCGAANDNGAQEDNNTVTQVGYDDFNDDNGGFLGLRNVNDPVDPNAGLDENTDTTTDTENADNTGTETEGANDTTPEVTNNTNNAADEIFPDVENGKWFSDSIRNMKETGIMNGYPDGTFKRQNEITRGEIATVITNLLNYLYADDTEATDPAADETVEGATPDTTTDSTGTTDTTDTTDNTTNTTGGTDTTTGTKATGENGPA